LLQGTYIPPGKQPAPGERKLYLLIEATTEAAVKRAKAELKVHSRRKSKRERERDPFYSYACAYVSQRLIEEALISAAQSAHAFAQPTGRYSVV
jgi:hypothetical protein